MEIKSKAFFLGFLLLIAIGGKAASDASRLTIAVSMKENSEMPARISPEFTLSLSTNQQKLRVLKGIYYNYKNWDAIQATLVSPAGDTTSITFPELSATELRQAKAKPITLQISPSDTLKIPFDLHQTWPEFQKNTDTYVGPYPGTYLIRFEFGWSDQNWNALVRSGILKGWEEVLTKEVVLSEWLSFEIAPEIFVPLSTDQPAIKVTPSYSSHFTQYNEESEGLVTREWLIDSVTNHPLLVFTHDNPIKKGTRWEPKLFLLGTGALQLENYLVFVPSSQVSGSFIIYSNPHKTTAHLQVFRGRFSNGFMHGDVSFKYAVRGNDYIQVDGFFEDGNMDGQWTCTEHARSGGMQAPHVLSRVRFQKGHLQGLATEFYALSEGAMVKRVTEYSNGKIDGTDTHYYPNGQVRTIHNFLPEYVIVSLKEEKNELPNFPFSAPSQVRHGKFEGYFEDGSLQYRLNYQNNVPQGTCEFNLRFDKKEIETKGTFKGGLCFDGSFISLTTAPDNSAIQHIPRRQYWILHYENGRLLEKELIQDQWN